MKQHRKYRLASSRESGFTLLELLASMTLLLIMVGFLAVVFNAASVAWRQGEHDVDRAQTARATVDLMADDLAQAVVSTNVQFFGSTNSVAFVAPVNNDDPNSADLAEVVYAIQNAQAPYKLIRCFTTTTNSAWHVYANPPNLNWPISGANTSVVCDTVMNFALTYYYTNGNITTGNSLTTYWNSTPTAPAWVDPVLGTIIQNPGDGMMTNMPPAFVNIHLEVTDSRTAALLSTLSPSSPAYANLTNRATRSFDAYVKIPQR